MQRSVNQVHIIYRHSRFNVISGKRSPGYLNHNLLTINRAALLCCFCCSVVHRSASAIVMLLTHSKRIAHPKMTILSLFTHPPVKFQQAMYGNNCLRFLLAIVILCFTERKKEKHSLGTTWWRKVNDNRFVIFGELFL